VAKTALIVGGSGQIGRATATALTADGWLVVCAQRNPPAHGQANPAVEHIAFDRDQPGALARAVARGVDALIDTVAYDERHARQLLEVEADVGALVVISSASVYRDAAGRSLDEARETGFPRFPAAIDEDQPTVAPGPQTYSTRKVALEQTLLQNSRRPVAILRPGAIHGEGSGHCREWFFVRRILDGRRVVPLAYGGESLFHTSATINVAALITMVLETPVTAVLHAADPAALTVTQIGEAIARVYSYDWRLIPMPGPPTGGVGGSPWAVPHPIVLSTDRAVALGYRPRATYEDAVGAACRSAQALAAAGAAFSDYLLKLFDYASEDGYLSARSQALGDA